jgi:hypothetical protein
LAKRNTNKAKSGKRKRAQTQVLEDVLSLASTLLSSKKDWVADKVSNLSTVTHAYADALSEIPGVGTYATLTAESVDDLADYLSETDFPDIVRDGSIFAKKHPMQTLAGAVVAGIIATQIYRAAPKAR